MTTSRRTLFAFAVTVGLVAPATAERVSVVYFDVDSSEVGGDLQPIADELAQRPGGRIVLEAHADSTGTAPYNVALTGRRAEAVRDELVSLGVEPERFVLALYGEDGERRGRRALDRRVTIGISEEPLHAIIDDRLDRATAVMFGRPETQVAVDGPRPGEEEAGERVALP